MVDKNSGSPLVAFIIVNWNEENLTRACLNSLKQLAYANFKVFLVDNGSDKSVFDAIELEFNDFAILIRSDSNLGFTGGNNLGIQIALDIDPDYFLLLNNDTEVEPDFLSKIVTSAEGDPSIGIIGPKINFMDNRENIWAIGGKINLYTGNAKILWNNRKDIYDKEQLIDVDYVSGCALMIKTELLKKIGVLDNNYFCYYEEVDYCLRMSRKTHLRNVCRLDAKIYHVGSSTGLRIRGMKVYYLTRNRLYFLRKSNSALKYIISLALFFFIETPKYVILYPIMFKDIQILKFYYEGVIDFFKGVTGKRNVFENPVKAK